MSRHAALSQDLSRQDNWRLKCPEFSPRRRPTARSSHTRRRPLDRGRGASREVPGYQACILNSVAPVVRPGVDCSKGTALAWVLGIFSRHLSCADPDLRLSAMWFLQSVLLHGLGVATAPTVARGIEKLSTIVDIPHEKPRDRGSGQAPGAHCVADPLPFGRPAGEGLPRLREPESDAGSTTLGVCRERTRGRPARRSRRGRPPGTATPVGSRPSAWTRARSIARATRPLPWTKGLTVATSACTRAATTAAGTRLLPAAATMTSDSEARRAATTGGRGGGAEVDELRAALVARRGAGPGCRVRRRHRHRRGSRAPRRPRRGGGPAPEAVRSARATRPARSPPWRRRRP